MTKQIAFIDPTSVPLANKKTLETLTEHFNDYEIDLISVKSLIKSRLDILVINTLYVIFHYGLDIILGYKIFKKAFWRTPYIFHKVKHLLARRLRDIDYTFTFQMQSLFDCSLPGVPHFIYTDHTHLANLTYPDYDEQRLYRHRWLDLEKQIYRNATLIFVRSSNIEKSLTEEYNQEKEKVKCVYTGFNVDTNISSKRDKDFSHQNILFVGLDWERKGGPDLIKAFKLVLEKYPSATLTIVGADPQIQVPNTKIVGKVSPQSLTSIYNDATLFCLPTHLEPFGIAILEAMRAHLPIVSTKIGAIPDFIKDGWNGWLVEPSDVNGIADAMMKLLADPDLCRKFGERNFSLTQERYSWNAVGERLHKYILQALPNDAA